MNHVDKIIEALSDKEAYDIEVSNINLIHTAVSYVFLTGKYAYKINKPINISFLDLTTLEKRKETLDKELKLNSILCPDLYKQVLPITEKDREIKIGGNGNIIEYALKMKEFPQNGILTNLLRENKVTKENISNIAKLISDFHKKTPTSNEISQHGSFNAIKALWEDNLSQTEEFKDKTITSKQFDFIKTKINNFFKNNNEKFEKRIKAGKVRYNHGDFHSGNICISDKIYIFDRIVFNMKFPCSDIIAEIAFLAMDLDLHRREDLSNYFIEQYLKESKDEKDNKLLDFYKCHRAYIRGRIGCIKLQDKNISEEEREKSIKEAKDYFDLAYKYSLNL